MYAYNLANLSNNIYKHLYHGKG